VKQVVFDKEAEAEMRAAIAYYNSQRAGLGDEFSTAVEQAVGAIVQSPKAFSPHGSEGLRKFVMKRFPYYIFYLELDSGIWIAAVAHQRRRPGYWAHRKP